ncbi:MAG: DUF4253 domain-containing protein [Cyanobacteria bacterium SZAS TMP-1]|nr:DUF4253 domain-containing protein [Cyanobacteria bacterium SZAS TMP-1]
MTNVNKLLEVAGVKGATAEPFDLYGQKNCFSIAIDSRSPMKVLQQLRSVTEETGFFPVFPAKGEPDKWNFEEAYSATSAFVPASGPGPAVHSQKPNYTTIEDASERRNAIRQDMLKEYGMTDATAEQLNRPLTQDKLEAVIRNDANPMVLASMGNLFDLPSYKELSRFGPPVPSINEMIAQQIEHVEQLVSTTAGRPQRHAYWNALKNFEAEALSKFCKVGKQASLAGLISAGENLDVEKWLELKKADAMVETGDFSKEKLPAAKSPTSKRVLLLPVKKAWHVPAILRLGNWNENPPAQVHVAMLKRWHERFGAEVVAVGRDTMYVEVKTPVSTKDAALQLAYEQFAYCPDTVLQGGDGTLSGLAVDLLDRRVWQFWWD